MAPQVGFGFSGLLFLGFLLDGIVKRASGWLTYSSVLKVLFGWFILEL